VLKLFGMGSVLLSTPMLDVLRQTLPGTRVLYATFGANAGILHLIPGVDSALIIQTASPVAFLRSTLAALRTIRAARPGMVFDLEFFSKFATALAALSGAPVRVGFALPTRWRRWNLTHAVPLDRNAHVNTQFLRQLAAVGVRTGGEDARLPRLRPDDAAQKRVRAMTGGAPYICVNINAGTTSLERRWPADRFLEVVERCRAAHPGLQAWLIGTREERPYVAAALDARPAPGTAVRNVAGDLDVPGLAALLADARLLLTNDSGPMHVGAAVGTPVVALFGPESPALYGPRGDAVVITRSLPCSPCLSVYNAKLFRCPYDAQCMREITVGEVTAAVLGILGRRPHREPATSGALAAS
jgi:ADP-heptose:LPS heptosyltransferase